MILSEISIKRPVFAIVINIVLIALGIVSLTRLGIREYPKIETPRISVSTTYSGAGPEIMETQITKVLEDAISGVQGIDYIYSTSQRSRSSINIIFNANKDLEQAANDVRDKVSRAKRRLPEEVSDPIVQKSDADADAIMNVVLMSDNHNPVQMTEFAEKVIKSKVELLEGVASVDLWGARYPQMKILLDPQKLAAYNLTYADVESALRRQNIEIPSGTIKSKFREFSVILRTDLNQVQEFENIILKSNSQSPELVRLVDVAKISLSSGDESARPRVDKKSAIVMGILKQSDANPLAISKALNQLMPELTKELQEGMTLKIVGDSTIFIDKSLKSVYRTIVEAIIFVGIIIFLFLHDWRSTLVPIVTIPIALIGTLFFMYLLNYSINNLTLLAFVLAIGLVVDDAIVMLENIHRYTEEGLSPFKAAMVGSKEIGFAIIAMTITLSAVFLPLAFLQGKIGRLFIEFAVTLAVTVLISGFTALTLSPMMCAKLHFKPMRWRIFTAFEQLLNHFTKAYQALLARILKMRLIKFFALIFLIIIASSLFALFKITKSETAPSEDRGMISIRSQSPEGSTLDFVDQYFGEVEEMVRKNIPYIETILSITGIGGGGSAVANLILEDWDKRDLSQAQITEKINQFLPNIAVGLTNRASSPPSLAQSSGGRPIEIVFKSNADYKLLSEQLEQIINELNANPNLNNIDHDLRLNTIQLEVEVNREKLALLGIEIDTLGRTLETALGGRQVTRYKQGADQYDVIVKIDEKYRQKPQDLEQLYVKSNKGKMIPLSNLVSIKETIAPQSLKHFNKMRSITISAGIKPGTLSQAEGIEVVEQTIRKIAPQAQIDYTGSSREFKQTASSIYEIFIMALIFIYLVLAAQFESWIDPLIIIISVPMGLLGALIALNLTGNSINIYSQIGLITLVGLITKHGILIIEFANQLRETGKEKMTAIIESCGLRLRPILMTTSAMVIGAIPLVMSKGAGHESREAIGWVIVGGLSLGTLLTLFVVPIIYLIFSKNKEFSTDK